MTLSQNIRHRRAVANAAAAVQRREPAPQLGFDPTAIFGHPTFGRPTDILPPDNTDTIISVTNDNLPTSSIQSTSTQSTTSATTSSTIPTTSSTVVVPTTTSTKPAAVNPTTSAQSVHLTTLATHTDVLTVPGSRTSASIAATAAAASSTAVSGTGSMSTGVVVGGIGAGIVAIAAIGFAITFFIRRSRKRNDTDFNEGNFRRSAMMLDDPPTHEDTVNRGFNPPPPTMIERHIASPAPTFGTQYGHPGPGYNQDGYPGAGDYSQNYVSYGKNYQSFSPGQVINANNSYPSPIASQPAHPMFPGSAYVQSPFSPVSPNEQYAFQDHNQASGGGYPVLTRQGSNHSQEAYRQTGEPNVLHRESLPANDYVDLNRSSVTPYQEAQYVEISRRLNTDVPEGLHTPEINHKLPPVPSKSDLSPFSDPSSAPPSPGGQYAIDRRHLESSSAPHQRSVSDDSMQEHNTLDFPAPPSPVHAPTSRYRIDSTPPSLPEINIESRVSVSSYPMLTSPSMRNSDAPSGMLTPGVTAVPGSRFPTTPSPLASSFGMPSTPPAAAMSMFATPPSAVPTATEPSAHALGQSKRGSTYSMYDAEDAYGGI